jgi:hypothetical protein
VNCASGRYLSTAFGVMAFTAFRQGTQNTKFTEIDIQRINIVNSRRPFADGWSAGPE